MKKLIVVMGLVTVLGTTVYADEFKGKEMREERRKEFLDQKCQGDQKCEAEMKEKISEQKSTDQSADRSTM